MTTGKRTRGTPVPLVIEDHPNGYDGYPFLTLLQYRKQHNVTIIDNSDDRVIKAYVLDRCGPEGVNEEQIIEIAAHWYETNRKVFPISIEFSRQGFSHETSRIYHTFNIEFITRIIGPLPRFEMCEVHSIKRRRRKPVSSTIQIFKKSPKSVVQANPLVERFDVFV